MKSKNLVIGLIIAAVVIGAIFILGPRLSKKAVPKKTSPDTNIQQKGKSALPAKKNISKGKGVLIVRVKDSRNNDLPIRMKAFRSIDSRSSVYATSLAANKAQELYPGTYDLELDSIPQKIYRNVRVAEGKENIENIGCLTGSINVKILNINKQPASYPVRVLYARSNEMALTTVTNRSAEILPGVYDLEIGTIPKLLKNDVRVEAGKEMGLDLGCATGSLIIKAVDETGKEVRCPVNVIKSGTNKTVSRNTTNKVMELIGGTYTVDLISVPKQPKKDVKIIAGQETVTEYIIQAPPRPAPQAPREAAKKITKTI